MKYEATSYIEIFSANCPLCRHMLEDIQIGKCQVCNQTVYNVNQMTDEIKRKMKDYGVTSVATTIIDGNIKVVSIPDFPWICGEDLYLKLKRDHP
ncbi:MAG: thioredoxin family protein [Thermoproteota archaeon]|nr:thioredoxin family protein [Thermoproteota archaeon]